jgi:hypothetical protein
MGGEKRRPGWTGYRGRERKRERRKEDGILVFS